MKINLLVIFLLLLINAGAQVEDHFDDGDFSGSPAWSGDNSDFNVNAAGQLQLNAAMAGNSFLSVPANLNILDSCEWRFYIRLNFSPSSSNYARVYLSSDQADLQQPLNGYFLQFGESLSNDAIELFRQNGTTVTSVCRAQNGLIANAFSVGVKIVRNNTGSWILAIDYSGGTNYNIEATGADATFNNAAFIGVNCVYTSGNVSRFYFDDFYAGPEIPDTVLPFITKVSAESDSLLSVTFSEKMDTISLNDINNYTVDNGVRLPSFIFPDSLDPLKYYLRFSISFHLGVTYTILFSGLKDLNQNLLVDNTRNFVYFPVEEAQLNDVVFSEIYFEPSSLSPLPNSEFIELYNRKDSSILISGWKISDGISDGLIPSFRLGPLSYVVLYSVNDSAEFLSVPNALAVVSFPILNNDVGDRLVLSDANGELINELKFNDEYYHDNHKNNGGWTIERIDPDFTCKNEYNWKASSSNAHGTPGLINSVNGKFSDSSSPFALNVFLIDSSTVLVIFSEAVSEGTEDISNYRITGVDGNIFGPSSAIKLNDDSVELHFSFPFTIGTYTLQISSLIKDCPGNAFETNHKIRFGFPENAEPKDILINELLFKSFDGGNDFLELYNSSQKIIDLKDWIIAEADFNGPTQIKDNASITRSHRLMFPGDYLVLSEDEKKVKSFYTCNDAYAFLNVSSMPDFNSDRGRAIIFDQNGNEMDAFRYSDDMHFQLLAETKGISLERLSIKETNDKSINWHSAAATAGFATPGYGNSQRLDLLTDDGEVSIGMEIFSPDNDGYNDVLAIHYNFPQAGTVLSLNVYDCNGQPVRTLLSGETVSNEGMIFWDGLTDDHSMARGGIYILLARSFDLNGNDQAIKKTCFLTRRF